MEIYCNEVRTNYSIVFVERRLVNIVYRIMKDKRPYKPPIKKENIKAAGQYKRY